MWDLRQSRHCIFSDESRFSLYCSSPHTARDTAAFLDHQDLEVMDWPARSPDMSPIEHVWDQMSVWIRDMDDPRPL